MRGSQQRPEAEANGDLISDALPFGRLWHGALGFPLPKCRIIRHIYDLTCCHLRLPQPWLINQTPKMPLYKMSVLLVAGMAALVSTGANAREPLVDVRSVDPTITVELRYAGPNNLLGHSLYPVGTRALVRPEVASALAVAQRILRRYKYGLKIWDAYRPAAVQAKLWQASLNSHYVANPEYGVGSLHSLGIAVDVTLVDSRNRDVRMPTDFDDFTPAAMEPFMGSSFEIGGRARLLKYAMHKAGFAGLRFEWWHFTIADWQKYLPPEKAKGAAQVLRTHQEGGL